MDGVVIPDSFLAMPRWWTEGASWLAQLPQLIRSQCLRWDLRMAGDIMHGSNALVIPVVRDGRDLVLRLSPPGAEVTRLAAALRFWDGRGTVLIIDADAGVGAMLLERLDGPSLRERPVDEAMSVLGQVMRRLAVPGPGQAPSTADLVQSRAGQLDAEFRRLATPFDRAFLAEALDVADALGQTDSDLAVNGDLHSEQVLRGGREPWTVVDPVLLRGDIDYDLARVLWTRVDEIPDATTIIESFETVVGEATLDRERARDWVVFRTVDYWLWGLGKGLTEDPARCQRLAAALVT